MATTTSDLVQTFRQQVQNKLGHEARQIHGAISEVYGRIVALDVKFDTPFGIVTVASTGECTPVFFDRHGKQMHGPMPKPIMSSATKDLLSGDSAEGSRGRLATRRIEKTRQESPVFLVMSAALIAGAVTFIVVASFFASLLVAAGIAIVVAVAILLEARISHLVNRNRAENYQVSVLDAMVGEIYAVTDRMTFLGGPVMDPRLSFSDAYEMSVLLDEMKERLNDEELNPAEAPKIEPENYYRLRDGWSTGEDVYAVFKVIFQNVPGRLYATGSGYRFVFDARNSKVANARLQDAREQEEQTRQAIHRQVQTRKNADA